MFTSKKIIVFVLVILLSGLVNAVSYGPSLHQAEWQLELSPFACRMWQPIPHFGKAVFANRAGEEQTFSLQPVRRLMAKSKADMLTRAPIWNEERTGLIMGSVPVKSNGQPIQLGKQQSYRLLNELYDGMSPVFSNLSWFDKDESIEVFMSSVHFRKAYNEYKDCLASLLPVNFDQIKRTRINFASAKSELSPGTRDLLAKIVQYVKTDPKEISFFIDGHTDNVGRRLYNLQLSKSRAEAVLDYLVGSGVSEDLITTRYHGERYPIKNNKTVKNRAANRRVTIRLDREGDV